MITNKHVVFFLVFLLCFTSNSQTGGRHPAEDEDTQDGLVTTANSQISKTERFQSRSTDSTTALETLRRKEEGGLLFSDLTVSETDYTVSETDYTEPPGHDVVSGVWPVTTTRRTTAGDDTTAVQATSSDGHELSHTDTTSVDGVTGVTSA
ncbi:hypothetical protein BaRGS_00032088, partial [Batillaria attramentaria]